MENIQAFRQPMVTATGIFLGFLLNFILGWVPDSFTIHRFKDAVIAVGAIISIALLIVALYGMLRIDYREDLALVFYKKTLRLFIIAVSIPFISIVIIIMYKLVVNIFYSG